MFGLFKKKTKSEVLQKEYKKLMGMAHTYSTTDRKKSDMFHAKAQLVYDEIDKLGKESA